MPCLVGRWEGQGSIMYAYAELLSSSIYSISLFAEGCLCNGEDVEEGIK